MSFPSTLSGPPEPVVEPVLTGAQVLTSILRTQGITTVFGYPGTSELALCDAIAAADDLTLTNSRGDREAVFMAAGFNLVSPPRAAALLHGARGLTNALGAIADVRRSEIPVLCLVGMASRPSARFLPPHAEPELIAAAGRFARDAYDFSTVDEFAPEHFVKLVTGTIEALRSGPHGPVLLGVPQDVLSTPFVPARLLPGAVPAPRPDTTDELQAAVLRLAEARSPVILVDDHLLRAGPDAEQALDSFADLLGAPVLQVAYRRGPMLFQRLRKETVRRFVGPYEPSDPAHRGLLRSADLLVTIEDRNMYPRVVGPLPGCAKVALTSNRLAALKNDYLTPADPVVVGDVPALLRRISGQLGRSGVRRAPAEPSSRPAASCDPGAVELVRAVARSLDAVERPVIVDDSQMFGGLIAANYELLPTRTRVFGSHGGFVGGGLSTAAGLAMSGSGDSVLCTVGDQGFTNGIQALAAVGEKQAPLVVLVCNNGASVSLRKQAEFDGLNDHTHLAMLGNSAELDYCAVARGYGLRAERFEWSDTADGDELSALVVKAFQDRGPHVIELVVPGDRRFWNGVWSVAGLEQAER